MRLLKLNFKCVCLSVCARTLPIFFLILCDLEFSTAESHLYPAAPWDARCLGSSPLLLFFIEPGETKTPFTAARPPFFRWVEAGTTLIEDLPGCVITGSAVC